MMTLAHMWSVLRPLEKGRSPLLEQIAALWGSDPNSVQLLRASANFVCSFTREAQPYILRFNFDDERSKSLLQAEIDYLLYLASQGIPIAKPIQSLNGHFVESLSTSEGTFHAVVFDALAGEHPEFDDLTPEQFRQWGQALGHLHTAASAYSGDGRPTWHDHIAFVASHLPAQETAAHAALARSEDQLNDLPITPRNSGLIHFDFEMDNLLWHDGEIGIIDFDDSAFYWFAADIAFALRDLFHDDAAQVNLTDPSFLSFLEGYRSVRPISDEELQHIPLFLRLLNLIQFARITRSLTELLWDEPDWMRSLRDRFKSKMQTYRAGFERYSRE